MANLIPVEHDPFDMAGTLAWQRGVDTAQGFDRQAPEPMPGTDRAYDLMLAMGRAGGDLRKNAPLLWETSPGRMAQGLARFASGGTPAASPGLRREDYTDDPNARQPVEPMIHDAMNVADVMSMGGMPMAKAGAAGIFGGRLAVTADHQALNRAEALAKAGAPKEQIWNETGWFRGADDKWRFEIPDNNLSVRKGYGAGLEFGEGEAWGRFAPKIEHQDLTAAYPRQFDYLAHDVTIRRGANPEGRFMPNGAGRNEEFHYSDKPVLPTLFIESPTTKQARSIAAHELQHSVQGHEGFLPGSNPNSAFGVAEQPTLNQIRAQKKEIGIDPYVIQNKIAAGYKVAPDDLSKLEAWKALTAREDQILANTLSPYESYRRHAGEVEARNVQTRMDMTPEQRRAKPPWETEDVPIGQQIVRGLEGRADGGPVAPGQSYIVGENGPEVFTPNERGAIIPPAVAASIQSRLIPVDHDPFEGN